MKLQGQSDPEVDLGPTEQTACGFHINSPDMEASTDLASLGPEHLSEWENINRIVGLFNPQTIR